MKEKHVFADPGAIVELVVDFGSQTTVREISLNSPQVIVIEFQNYNSEIEESLESFDHAVIACGSDCSSF